MRSEGRGGEVVDGNLQVKGGMEWIVESREWDPRGKSKNKVENRSEEHTSELQSLRRISYAVFCLKKKEGREGRDGLECWGRGRRLRMRIQIIRDLEIGIRIRYPFEYLFSGRFERLEDWRTDEIEWVRINEGQVGWRIEGIETCYFDIDIVS